MTIATTAEPLGRAARLKAGTAPRHQKVDDTVMAAAPFASRENYARFLAFQYRLHSQVQPVYADPALQDVLPGLASRSRFADVAQDLADLDLAAPSAEPSGSMPLPESLGWLYVVEGSNMGAAFLLKAAGGLGLSEDFGARHLAGHAEGRGLHWRRFREMLDAVALSEEEDKRAIAAADAAFQRVLDLVAAEM